MSPDQIPAWFGTGLAAALWLEWIRERAVARRARRKADREARAALEAMTCEHLSTLDVLDGHRCPCRTTSERPAA